MGPIFAEFYMCNKQLGLADGLEFVRRSCYYGDEFKWSLSCNIISKIYYRSMKRQNSPSDKELLVYFIGLQLSDGSYSKDF